MTTVHYSELLPKELQQRIDQQPIAYLPLGTLEWHGEHLPLGTDAIQADGLMTECARLFGGVVLPAIHVGPDTVEEQLPYSCYWIPTALFRDLTDGILLQLKRVGFRAVFAHGHGPSYVDWAQCMPDRSKQFELTLFGVTRDIRRQWKVQVDHAGRKETSLMQHLRPELVHLERLPTDPELWPVGVTGQHPNRATPDYGALCLKESLKIVERLFMNAGFLKEQVL